jgi:hypothetical protein
MSTLLSLSVQQWYVYEICHSVRALIWVQWSNVAFKSVFAVWISIYEFVGSLWISYRSHYPFIDMLEYGTRFLYPFFCIRMFIGSVLFHHSWDNLRDVQSHQTYLCCYAVICYIISLFATTMHTLPLSKPTTMLFDTWMWVVYAVVPSQLLMQLLTMVTEFLGRWSRCTGSQYVVRYLWEIFTLRIENEPVNPGQGRRTRVEGRRWWTRFMWLCSWPKLDEITYVGWSQYRCSWWDPAFMEASVCRVEMAD